MGLFEPFYGMKTIVSGESGAKSKTGEKVDLLNVDLSNPNGEVNDTFFFGSNDPGTMLINAPYTASPFYGIRFTIVKKFTGSENVHLISVVILEQYPVPGRIWANTYDSNSKDWIGWHSTN